LAPPTRRRHPARILLTLAVLVVAVFGTVLAGTKWSDASWTPKLALDLEGGTQLILAPVTEDQSSVTQETINQAIEVIRQRVDSSGVAEAEITSQGGSNIVVALPGRPSEETLDLVRTSAQMEFRPVLTYSGPEPAATDTTTDAATDGATAAPTDAATDAATDPAEEPSDEPTKAAPDSASDAEYYITPAVQARYDELDCTKPENLTGGESGDPDEAPSPATPPAPSSTCSARSRSRVRTSRTPRPACRSTRRAPSRTPGSSTSSSTARARRPSPPSPSGCRA
jgi:preprotein translocase subunit SecD